MVRVSQRKAEVLQHKMENLRASDNHGHTNKLIHNLSLRTLTHGETRLLQHNMGHNLMDAQAIDFVAALRTDYPVDQGQQRN